MWPTVQAQDIADRWRPLSAAEKTVATTRIADAEAELRTQLRLRGVSSTPSLELSAAVAEWEQTYIATVVEMVRRYLLNTEAWLEVREAIDDFDQTKRRDSAVSAGLIYVSDAELAKLLPAPERPKRGAFSIRLGSS